MWWCSDKLSWQQGVEAPLWPTAIFHVETNVQVTLMSWLWREKIAGLWVWCLFVSSQRLISLVLIFMLVQSHTGEAVSLQCGLQVLQKFVETETRGYEWLKLTVRVGGSLLCSWILFPLLSPCWLSQVSSKPFTSCLSSSLEASLTPQTSVSRYCFGEC